jgi:hypothetical protein
VLFDKRNRDEEIFKELTAGNLGMRVILQASIQNGVRNLIAHFVLKQKPARQDKNRQDKEEDEYNKTMITMKKEKAKNNVSDPCQ